MIPLKIAQISKIFDRRQVLDSIDLQVNHNEIFGFVGLNGIGKTTLIKIILDLLGEDRGEIEIFGINKALPESRKNLFYLPEKFQPSKKLKGEEFLRFSQDFYNKKYDAKRAEELCCKLDLQAEMLQQKVDNYSKGMTQKLGLIAVFMSQADLIILDEPMSGLDLKARINLKRELLEYRKLGKTVFFSSHILTDIDEICDQIAILNMGKITFRGSPEAFKVKYGQDTLDKAFLYEIGV